MSEVSSFVQASVSVVGEELSQRKVSISGMGWRRAGASHPTDGRAALC